MSSDDACVTMCQFLLHWLLKCMHLVKMSPGMLQNMLSGMFLHNAKACSWGCSWVFQTMLNFKSFSGGIGGDFPWDVSLSVPNHVAGAFLSCCRSIPELVPSVVLGMFLSMLTRLFPECSQACFQDYC